MGRGGRGVKEKKNIEGRAISLEQGRRDDPKGGKQHESRGKSMGEGGMDFRHAVSTKRQGESGWAVMGHLAFSRVAHAVCQPLPFAASRPLACGRSGVAREHRVDRTNENEREFGEAAPTLSPARGVHRAAGSGMGGKGEGEGDGESENGGSRSARERRGRREGERKKKGKGKHRIAWVGECPGNKDKCRISIKTVVMGRPEGIIERR